MPTQQLTPQIRYIDRPEVSETFADSLRAISYDGQTMRIEFCAMRMDDLTPPTPPAGRQYPVCRLVLTPNAGIDLFNKLQQIMAALEQSGAVKKTPPPLSTPPTVQ